MSKHEKTRYKEKLEQLLRRAGASRAELRDESMQGTGGEPSGGISDVPIHPADLGNRTTEEEVSLRLLENEEQLLEEINLALARLEDGTFGKCEACGRRIDEKRLQSLPYTRWCIRCAREREEHGRVRP